MVLALACEGRAWATDVLMPGVLAIIKDARLVKVLAKPGSLGTFPIPVPGSGGDPLIGSGAVSVFDTGGAGILHDPLADGSWYGLGTPRGSQGYVYRQGPGASSSPVRLILLKSRVVKILANDDGSLNGPVSGSVGVILSTGTTPDRYCAAFGGTPIRNEPGFVKRRAAPAPASCPSYMPPGSCAACNHHVFLGITTTNTPGDCGDIIDLAGTVIANVACGGFYSGGGATSIPLPYPVPDQAKSIAALTTCAGSVAAIGPTTSSQTGSNLTCTSAGCRFGPPLAVPNPSSTVVSFCVINTLDYSPSGAVDCATGATDLSVPISSVVFLTGDGGGDPGGSIAGIQPCPLCSAGVCTGGANQSGACTPGTSTLGGNPSYPTSHDCPPDPMMLVGTLPIAFSLTSGTVVWTGTDATNDTGSTVTPQSRVFTGYCRDKDVSLHFEQPPRECWRNGAAVGAPCAGVFETCEQHDNGAFNGAFGPGLGGANRTISVIGHATILTGSTPAPLTLVGLFSIPPTYDIAVDSLASLPGPGAAALSVTAKTCALPSYCGM